MSMNKETSRLTNVDAGKKRRVVQVKSLFQKS